MNFSIKKLTGEIILGGEHDHCFNCWVREADLREADLRGANLRGADLCAPTVALLSLWGEVSDELCADLMEFDAYCHDDRTAFDEWVKTGKCPYSGVKYQRAVSFTEKKTLWGKGKLCSPLNLMKRLIAEKCKDSDFHLKKEPS